MGKKFKIVFAMVVFFALTLIVPMLIMDGNIPVLNSKGWIGDRERDLILLSTILMSLVVIPVYLLTLFIAWKYRADNTKADYQPKWDHSLKAEIVWWGAPFIVIVILGFFTYKSCYELDPFRKIEGDRPLKIQVVALQWKWLFIYPEQQIATVNFVQFPEKTPVFFEITSDAPMNSFWIPALGGQIYAMSGMSSQLHLIANEQGEFRGSSANISGRGFSGMTFTAKASTEAEFEDWVSEVRSSGSTLGLEEYKQLAEPTEYNPPAYYVLGKNDLYRWIVMQYMKPVP